MVASKYECTQAMVNAVESIVNPFRGKTNLMTEKNEPVPPDMQAILERIKTDASILEYTKSVDLGAQAVTAIIRTILYDIPYTIDRSGQVQVSSRVV